MKQKDNKGKYKATNEQVVSTLFNAEYPEWEYAGGYTTSDSYITIRCRKCGAEITKSYITIRHHKALKPCKACAEADAIARKKAYEEQLAEWRRQRQEKYDKAHSFEHTCPVCGKLFTGTKRRVFCSHECGKRWSNIKASQKKDKRFGAGQRIHWRDIYNRTRSLTCAICGTECDVNDYITLADGTIVCGDNYPSVDHIVPCACGGTDTFDNVQLACRGCNTKKGAKSVVSFIDDQLAINF